MKNEERTTLYKVRQQLQQADIVGKLIRAFEGEEELSEQQLRIGLALINKIAPNLSTRTIEGEVKVHVNHREMTREEIKGRLIELHAERLEAA